MYCMLQEVTQSGWLENQVVCWSYIVLIFAAFLVDFHLVARYGWPLMGSVLVKVNE